jgi:hypothetical protein
LFCKRAKYIKVLFELDEKKVLSFSKDIDIEQLLLNLNSFEKIACGDKTAGLIACMDLPDRFRWLTAVRSSAIQTSRPHPGLCDDLDKTVKRLFEELVL